MTTRVVPLAAHPQYVAPLVEAFRAEWPEWCGKVARSEVERCFACGIAGQLPQAYAALEGDAVIGTIALRPYFGDEPIPETPWVRGLLVLPPWRGGPAFRLLGDAAENAAREMGFRTVYSATTSIERLIARRGWETFRHVERDGEAYAWLRKDLG